MHILFLLIISISFAYGGGFLGTKKLDITCDEIKDQIPGGSIMHSFSSEQMKSVSIIMYIATRRHIEPLEVNYQNLKALKESGFDPSISSIIIIHGWKSGSVRPWVLKMKDGLLRKENVNVFLVDWAAGSCLNNYVNAARNSQVVSIFLYNYFNQLRYLTESISGSSSTIMWHHFYFIGHSLGAQISGQAAYLLKKDGFWLIDRITGLDPARPCFEKISDDLRLEITDADYVDVIHTQIGSGGLALGVKDNIGHTDFYVNGGTQQPACIGKFIPDIQAALCSHKLANTYFIESLYEERCAFLSYHWDGTYRKAQDILSQYINAEFCANCPTMGYDAALFKTKGVFFLVTSINEPYCQYKKADNYNVQQVVENLNGNEVIFDRPNLRHHVRHGNEETEETQL